MVRVAFVLCMGMGACAIPMESDSETASTQSPLVVSLAWTATSEDIAPLAGPIGPCIQQAAKLGQQVCSGALAIDVDGDGVVETCTDDEAYAIDSCW